MGSTFRELLAPGYCNIINLRVNKRGIHLSIHILVAARRHGGGFVFLGLVGDQGVAG
jgi:hypothetical protein